MSAAVLTAFVANGRDNTIELRLLADGVVIDGSSITKVELAAQGQSFNSDDDPTLFDLSQKADGIVILKLGGAGLDAGENQQAELYVYDAVNVNGIHWRGTDLRLDIYD